MQINWTGLIVTIINIVLYLVILIGIFKAIKEIKNFINKMCHNKYFKVNKL